MHQRLVRLIGQKALKNLLAGGSGGEADNAAGEGFAQAYDIGLNVSLIAGEQRTRAPEPGEDLVGNEQKAVFLGRR